MTTATQLPTAGTYVADVAHSTFAFEIRHNGISAYRNRFDDVSATVASDGETLSIEGAAKVESIAIGIPIFRTHMLGDAYFDAANHPEIAFRSSALRIDGDRAELDGELTLRGTTKPIAASGTFSAPIVNQFGRTVFALAFETTISRADFGMTANVDLPGGGKLLGDEVKIAVVVEFVRED